MRSINQRKNKKPIILIVSAVLVVAVGGFAYLAIARPFNKQAAPVTADKPVNTVDYGPPSQQDLTSQQDKKNEVLKSADTSNGQLTTTSDIAVSIVRVSQETAGQPVNIRVQIDGTTTGSCQVTLTKSGQPTISKTFSVVFEATSSRCQDSDIPIADFSQGGEWQLKVVVVKDSKQSKPAELPVTVDK